MKTMQTNNIGVQTLNQAELTNTNGGSSQLPYIASNKPTRIDDTTKGDFLPLFRIDPAVCPFPQF